MNKNIIPNISIDCLLFGFSDNKLNVLLNKRELVSPETGENTISDFTLVGHHMLEGENSDQAAFRILKRITGFDDIYLEQFYTFTGTDRFKEKDYKWVESLNMNIASHVISIGYYALVDKTNLVIDKEHKNAHWFPVDELPELGFDHKDIVNKGIESLKRKFEEEPIGFELLPEKFTLTQLQKLYESVAGKPLDRRNFRKQVLKHKYIIPLDEKQKGVTHKPAQVHIFSKDVYERTKKTKRIFA